MFTNERAHASTWAHKNRDQKQYIPLTGPRIEDLDIGIVWDRLGLGPLRGTRGRASWRDGDGYNVALDSGRWFDHARGEGGGVLSLVEIVLGCDRRGALEWLAENFGVGTGGTHGAAARRELTRRRAAARAEAECLIARRDEAFNEIREEKRQRLEEYHALNGAAYETEDIESLGRAEDTWADLELLDRDGDELLAEMNAEKLEQMLRERRAR